MFPTILSIFLTTLLGQEDHAKSEAQLLVDTIEVLQQPVEDFRCEFEGTQYFKGKTTEYTKVGENGLYESFSGVFIWKRGGDMHYEILSRRAFDNQISRHSVVVRRRQREAEEYYRPNNAPLGYAQIRKLEEVYPAKHNCPASIFLIDELKRVVAKKL